MGTGLSAYEFLTLGSKPKVRATGFGALFFFGSAPASLGLLEVG